MRAADPAAGPVADRELDFLFSGLKDFRRLLLAVSGGPDSTALLVLAHRWRKERRAGPALAAATVDHRLRPEAKREAADVAKFCRSLGVPHHTLVWKGKKPSAGLQEAARDARYRLLADLAGKLRADAIVTAHTLDDQAETFLMRLARGSGIAGLGGIRPRSARHGVALVRPLLGVPKARLVAVLEARGVAYAEDRSNADPRFLRPRLRALAPALAAEGLAPARLALAATRLARADAALEAAADREQEAVCTRPWPGTGPVEMDAAAYFRLSDEIALRLLGRAVGRAGNEGPAELGKLETLHEALKSAHEAGGTLRRTLAGALVSLDRRALRVARAPARRKRPATP